MFLESPTTRSNSRSTQHIGCGRRESQTGNDLTADLTTTTARGNDLTTDSTTTTAQENDLTTDLTTTTAQGNDLTTARGNLLNTFYCPLTDCPAHF